MHACFTIRSFICLGYMQISIYTPIYESQRKPTHIQLNFKKRLTPVLHTFTNTVIYFSKTRKAITFKIAKPSISLTRAISRARFVATRIGHYRRITGIQSLVLHSEWSYRLLYTNKSKYKKVSVLPIRIVKSNVVPWSKRKPIVGWFSLWRRANGRNVRLYYPYRQCINLWFRFVSLLISPIKRSRKHYVTVVKK